MPSFARIRIMHPGRNSPMLLVEDGKLSLDAPLTRYLPDAPTGWKAITLRHLLNHTSGNRRCLI